MTIAAAALRAGKRERQRVVLELSADPAVHTQEQLVAALHARGFDATQATVSRDLRELGLVRVHDADGTRYVALAGERTDAASTLRRALQDHGRSVEFVDGLGIVRTWPACAPLVGGALDAARLPEVAGTVAGDDTVLVVARGRAAARRLQDLLHTMMGGAA